MALDRREFLKAAGVQVGILAVGGCAARSPGALSVGIPAIGRNLPDVAVIGAGAFGGWTAFHLRRMGASVVLVDQYGPGNSRATSGDETRGIRSSYAERELWVRLANEAIDRWMEWEEEWARPFKMHLFFNTGDLILRADPEDRFIVNNRASWDKLGIPYEVLSIEEVRYRWPQINVEGMNAALYEPRAGVARARRSCEVVAESFRQSGGNLVIAKATLGPRSSGRLDHIVLDGKESLSAGQYVFACGPWLPKVLPEVMEDRLRTPLGRVIYFGTPPGDERFTFPNLPSFNFPGVTGWPALGPDNRGFRVRGGSRRRAEAQEGAQEPREPPPRPPSEFDPDLSVRWVPPEAQEGPRAFVEERFPDLADAPIVATYACHYESSVDRNPIVDRYPGLDNVWIAGGGSAEGFKLGPVIGEYIARRVLGRRTDPVLDAEFRLKEEKFEPTQRFEDFGG
ncbi:Monomeric sarcosine oxidase [bacterium HR33]|nr:Monomeric sarcosine oxidase [bacterium HR33]